MESAENKGFSHLMMVRQSGKAFCSAVEERAFHARLQ